MVSYAASSTSATIAYIMETIPLDISVQPSVGTFSAVPPIASQSSLRVAPYLGASVSNLKMSSDMTGDLRLAGDTMSFVTRGRSSP